MKYFLFAFHFILTVTVLLAYQFCVVQMDLDSRRTSLAEDVLPAIVFSRNIDPKERTRQIEYHMNEQAKVVQDLK